MTYLNIVSPLNAEYLFLIGRMRAMDTRSMHLSNFEVTLSCSLGNKHMLWTEEDYVEIEKEYPLPTDPLKKIDYEAFRARTVLYEAVMKRHGLLGTVETVAPVTGTNTKYLIPEGSK